MQESVKCDQCHQGYNIQRFPLILPCNHTLCSTCANDQYQQKQQTQCPQCKQISSQDPLDFQRNELVIKEIHHKKTLLEEITKLIESNKNLQQENKNQIKKLLACQSIKTKEILVQANKTVFYNSLQLCRKLSEQLQNIYLFNSQLLDMKKQIQQQQEKIDIQSIKDRLQQKTEENFAKQVDQEIQLLQNVQLKVTCFSLEEINLTSSQQIQQDYIIKNQKDIQYDYNQLQIKSLTLSGEVIQKNESSNDQFKKSNLAQEEPQNQKQIQEHTQAIQDLNVSNQQKQQKIQQLNSQSQQLKNQIIQMQIQNVSKYQKVQQLTSLFQLQSNQNQVNFFKENNEALKIQNQNKNKQFRELLASLKPINAQQLNALSNKKNDVMVLLNQLQEKLTQMKTKNAFLQNQVKESKIKQESLKKQVDQINNDVDDKQKTLLQKQNRVQTLKQKQQGQQSQNKQIKQINSKQINQKIQKYEENDKKVESYHEKAKIKQERCLQLSHQSDQ